MHHITPLEFENHSIRIHLDAKGQPWFNTLDVCQSLELDNPSQAVKNPCSRR